MAPSRSSRVRAGERPSRRAFPVRRKTMSIIRVLLADDHAVLRAGLRMLINAQPDMTVVGEAAESNEALEQTCLLQPDVLTLDLTMPGGGGIKILERLRRECPRTQI